MDGLTYFHPTKAHGDDKYCSLVKKAGRSIGECLEAEGRRPVA